MNAEAKAQEAFADRWTWAPEMRLTAEDIDWLQSIGVQP